MLLANSVAAPAVETCPSKISWVTVALPPLTAQTLWRSSATTAGVRYALEFIFLAALLQTAPLCAVSVLSMFRPCLSLLLGLDCTLGLHTCRPRTDLSAGGWSYADGSALGYEAPEPMDTSYPQPVSGSANYRSLVAGTNTVIGFLAGAPVDNSSSPAPPGSFNTPDAAGEANPSASSSSSSVAVIVGCVVGGLGESTDPPLTMHYVQCNAKAHSFCCPSLTLQLS